MISKKFRALNNKEKLEKAIDNFSKTDDMFYLAEVYLAIEKIFELENFPIKKFLLAKKRGKIKYTKIQKEKYNVN